MCEEVLGEKDRQRLSNASDLRGMRSVPKRGSVGVGDPLQEAQLEATQIRVTHERASG